MPRWEYAEDYVDDRYGWTDTLNVHGEDGWELIWVEPDQDDEYKRRLLFKRPMVDAD